MGIFERNSKKKTLKRWDQGTSSLFHRQQVQFLDITLSTGASMVRKHGLQVLKNGPSLKKVTQAKLLHHATGDRWTLDMTDSFCPIQKKNEGQEHCWWTIHWDSWTVKQNLSQQGRKEKKYPSNGPFLPLCLPDGYFWCAMIINWSIPFNE